VPLGNGALAEAARSGASVLVTPYDAMLSPLAAADDVVGDAVEICAVLAVPMMHGRRLLGVVAALDTQEDAFDQEAREVLTTLATHAGAALSNARLFADSERERRQSDAMAEIARAVGESLKRGEVMRLILRHAVALLQAEGACIALKDDNYLNVVSSLGVAGVLQGVHFPIASSIVGKVVTTGAATVSNNLSVEPDVYRPALRLMSAERAVIVPLVTARGIIGVLAVYNRPLDFSADDARVLQRLADQVAVAIVNARLFEEVQDATREWLAAFESIGVGMCVVDDDAKITRFNVRALQLAGQETPRTLVGRAFYDVFLGAPPELEEDALARAIRDGANARAVATGVNGRAFDIVAAPHPSGGAIVTFDDATAQRNSWDQHKLVFESSPDALLTIDADGHVAVANAAARQLFRRDDLAGVRWLDLVLHEMIEEARAHLQGAMDGAPTQHEYVVVRGDGDRRVVVASLAPIKNGGPLPMIVASLHDVSGERRAREAVALSESRYRHLFDSTTDAVFSLDFRGVFTAANPAACTTFGASSEQLLGRSLYPFLGSGDVDRVTSFLRDSLNGETRDYECTIVRRDGAKRTLTVSASPSRQGRAVVGIIVVARDVTDERQRAREVGVTEVRYAELASSGDDAIFSLDEEGNFTSVNAVFTTATGLKWSAIQGETFTLALDPRDRDAMWEGFVAALHGQRQRKELRFIDGAGASWWGILVATPLREEGRVTGVLAVVRNTAIEQQLVDAILQRQPIASVEQWRELHLTEVAESVISERRDAFTRAGITTTLAVDHGVRTTCGDRVQLHRLLGRLVDGACESLSTASGDRRIVIRLSQRGDRLLLTVEDNAASLSEWERDRAFTPFSGVRAGGDPAGLGLASVHSIVRLHGGRIDVERSEAGGNRFVVELPAPVTPSETLQVSLSQAKPNETAWPTS
ncbi:MAG: PAS domain S-box protein, partial [Gemmatimonadaceae bacterium]